MNILISLHSILIYLNRAAYQVVRMNYEKGVSVTMNLKGLKKIYLIVRFMQITFNKVKLKYHIITLYINT